MHPRPAADLAPLLAWLRAGQAAPTRLDFPAGTALPDGRLDLCKQALGPLGARAVAEALPPGGPIRHLLAGTDALADDGATAITDGALRAGVATVYLGCNGIAAGGACRIADRIAASPGVVTGLWLKRNPLGTAGLAAVADLAAAPGAPSTVDLVQTGLDAVTLRRLVAAVMAGRRVARLFLSGNPLGPAAADALATLVATGGLSELYVSAAGLGDAGAAGLAAGLRAADHQGCRPGLRRLSVASNGISPTAAVALIAAAADAGVETLDLGRVPAAGPLGAADNHLGPDGAAAAGAALTARPHRLAYLNLRSCAVGSRGALALLAAARTAATPTRFVLGGGIAGRVKRDLARLTAALPAPAPHPEVAAIASVHRTAPPTSR